MDQGTAAAFIRLHLSRGQLADLLQGVRAGRRAGGRMVIEGGFTGKAALRLAGYAAHEKIEQMFRENVPSHGGTIVDHVIPGTQIIIHQIFAAYGPVYVARATVGKRNDLPTANASRRGAAQLNAGFDAQERLEFMPDVSGRCFVLLLTRRSLSDIGAYDGIDIGVLNSDFSGFSLLEDADDFLSRYPSAVDVRHDDRDGDIRPPPARDEHLGMTLKPIARPFVGGEHIHPDEADSKPGSA